MLRTFLGGEGQLRLDEKNDGRGVKLWLHANPVDKLQHGCAAIRMPVDDDDVRPGKQPGRVDGALQIRLCFVETAYRFAMPGKVFLRQRATEQSAFRFNRVKMEHLPLI